MHFKFISKILQYLVSFIANKVRFEQINELKENFNN